MTEKRRNRSLVLSNGLCPGRCRQPVIVRRWRSLVLCVCCCCIVLFCSPVGVGVHAQTNKLQDQLQEDLASFARQLNLEPENPDVNYNMAQVYFRLNNIEMAAKYLERTIHLVPDDIESMQRLAEIYWKMGKLVLSRKVFRRAVVVDKNNAEIWLIYGMVLSDLGDEEGALSAFAKAVSCANDETIEHTAVYYSGLIHLSRRNRTGFHDALARLPQNSEHYAGLLKLGRLWQELAHAVNSQ